MGDIYTNPPQSRNEAILRATIDGTEYTAPPQSRIEDLLLELKEAIEQGGGAGGMSKDTYDPNDAVADAGGIAAYVDDEITDLHLGTASTKNSTSVVTQSTDLVESGAVYDALGFGNKNLCNGKATSKTDPYGVTWTVDPTDNNVVTVSGTPTGFQAFIISSDNVLETGTYRIFGLSDTVNVAYNAITLVKNGASVRTISTEISEGDTIEILDTDDYDTIEMQYKRKNNNVACSGTIRNMITKASNTDATYEPYHESVSDSLEEKTDNSVIGTVEDGAKPTKAYAVGEHMIRNGKFCTVTSAVTTSSTWTLGSNYVEGDVASELDEIVGTITASQGTLQPYQSKLVKKGNQVTLNLRISGVDLTALTATVIATIPSGFRPQTGNTFYFSGITDNVEPLRCYIGSSGNLGATSKENITNGIINLYGTYYI